MWNMRLKRIQIVLYLLALSGCAGTGKPNPAATPETSLKKETVLSTERRKQPPVADTNSEDDVYFSSDDTRVNERGQAVLRRHALRLKEHPQEIVTLVGYTDPLGSRSYNLALTEERMDSVVQLLRSFGVARGQIRRISAGRTQTVANCDTPACRQQMQRVELVYER